MILLGLKMLIGHRASCIGIIFGIFLATLLIAQQSAIFLGLISRSYRMISDIPGPDLWVVDKTTESNGKARLMPEGFLSVIKGIPGVMWAVPINVTSLPLVHAGSYQICELYGVDDSTFVGAPLEMVEGKVENLRRPGGIIVDVYSANGDLATTVNGKKVPLKMGDELEINKKRAVVVGICQTTRGYYPQPIIFTTNSQFHQFQPGMKGTIAFIAAKTDPKADFKLIVQKVQAVDDLSALTRDQIKGKFMDAFLKTGILINFGLSVVLGCIIGFSITGQIFYMVTMENLAYYALIKALGGTQKMILSMIATQALVTGLIGYTLGIGVTFLWGMAIKGTTLAFLFPWQLLLFTALITLIICVFAAGMSIRKVFNTDPKTLMGT